MPISTPHPDYDKFKASWRKVRLVCEGEEAVKAEGPLFLPALTGQESGEYDSYKERAMFYNASARTVQGLTGAIFRKKPDVLFPEKGLPLLETIGLRQESLEEVARTLVQRTVGIGRIGILVDSGINENSKPYLATYEAEDIINWQFQNTFDGEVATEIILCEVSNYRDATDPYVTKKRKIYRVLRLGDPNDFSAQGREDVSYIPDSELEIGSVYFQDVWEEVEEQQKGKNITTYVFRNRFVPKMAGGKLIRRIPFWCVNSESVSLDPQKPPLLDLVNVNISHYRNSADLEHGRHFTALPTAWVAGFDTKTQLTIGASRAWISDQTDAHAGFLEFTGAGLGHLQSGMEAKEKIMAVLGARMLEELPVGAESSEAVRLRQSGEASALASIALTCSAALTAALRVYAEWAGFKGDVSFTLNRDFNTTGIPPNVLQNLIMAVQGGLVSWNTFFYNMKKGELVPDSVDEAEELKLIKEGSAMFVIPTGPATKPTDKRIK